MRIISNWISWAFAILEVFFYAGAVYGFGFLQYMFEKENIFWDELCYDPVKHPNCTVQPDESVFCPADFPKTECEAQYQEFQSIFTWFLLTSSLSGLALDPLHQYTGTFVTRLIMSILTTSGIVCLVFYAENPYLIWAAWQLIGIVSVMYIIINVKELCAVFPALQSLVIGLMNGLYDASGGVFLLFKFVYDAPVAISLKDMLIFYAACSSVIWIKTFCLSSLTFAPENADGKYSIFEDSFIGRLFYKNNKIDEEKIKEKDEKVEEPPVSVWKYVFSVKYLLVVIFYTSLTIRTTSFPSWLYPWLKWTFSELEPSVAEENVSLMLDVYGYSYYLSILIAPLPGLFIKSVQKCMKSDLIGEHHALSAILYFSVLLGTSLSLQMCVKGSLVNAVMVTIVYSIFRTLFFISKGIFLYAQFPAVHFGTLYAISLVPGAGVNYLIDPLYSLILNGDDIADADFVPISIGLAVLAAISVYMPLYHQFWLGRFLPKQEKKRNSESTDL